MAGDAVSLWRQAKTLCSRKRSEVDKRKQKVGLHCSSSGEFASSLASWWVEQVSHWRRVSRWVGLWVGGVGKDGGVWRAGG